MKDHEQLWNSTKEIIREKWGEKGSHWFKLWFGDVNYESYDSKTHMLTVQVPSNYVYEFLEHYCVKDLREATRKAFQEPIAMQYRVMHPRHLSTQ